MIFRSLSPLAHWPSLLHGRGEIDGNISELAELPDDPLGVQLVNRVTAACVKKAAEIIASATPGEGAKDWAKTCLASPAWVSNQIVFGVIGIVDNQCENVPAATILSADKQFAK